MIVRHLLRATTVFMLSLSVLHAFSYENEVRISVGMNGGGAIFFELKSEGMKMVPVNTLSVIPGGATSWGRGKPSWRLELKPGSYIELDRVVYGESIPGFESTVAEELQPDIHYLVGVSGAGFAKGLEFYISEDKSGRRVLHVCAAPKSHPNPACE
jgi:hypothetical protein